MRIETQDQVVDGAQHLMFVCIPKPGGCSMLQLHHAALVSACGEA
jgi:hypothetical protein